MKALRWILLGLGGVVLLGAGGIAYLAFTFDTALLKPRIEAAAEQALGRRLVFTGPLRFSATPMPTVVAEDVSLANIEGGSRPAMLRVARVELQLGLMPLLSRQVDIRRLRLVEPDILLEADAEGRPNWVFGARRAPPDPAAPPGPAPAPRAAAATKVGVAEVVVEGGRVTIHSPVLGRAETIGIEHLQLRAAGEADPVQVEGRLAFAGQPFTLRGETGNILGLTGDQPWPYRVTIASAALEARVEGAMARAAATQDWRARIQASIPAAEALQPLADALLPGLQIPPAHDLRVEAEIQVEGNRLVPRALRVTTGALDLGALRQGLAVTRLEFAAPAADQPMRLSGEGRLGTAPLSVSGTLGAPAAFAPGAPPAPFPVDITVQAAGARLTLAGRIGDPRRLGDAALDLAVQVPDLAALAPVAGRPLPALGALQASAHVATTPAGMVDPLRLTALRIAAPAATLEGELDIATLPRPALRGRLSGPRLDVDALLAAFGADAPAPQAAAPNGAAAPNAAAAPRPAPARDRRVIPATPIRLEGLRGADAALRLAIGELRFQGIAYRDLATTLALDGGRARLAPFAVTLPGGRIAGTIAADARGAAPAIDITLRHAGEGLDLAPLLGAWRLPGYASGRLEFTLALAGQGADLRTLLGGADGRVTLAMAGGRIEPALLAAIPNGLRGVILPPGATSEGGLALQCLAFAGPMRDGVLASQTLLIGTGIGRIGGGGQVRFSNEALALRLLPDLRLGPIQLRAPVRVAGTLANPDVATTEAATAAAAGAIGALLGGQRNGDRGLQELEQALTGGGAGNPALPDCETALAAARGQPAPAPAPAAPAEAPQTEPAPRRPGGDRPPRPVDILRGLLGSQR